jgi:hypothetical protein
MPKHGEIPEVTAEHFLGYRFLHHHLSVDILGVISNYRSSIYQKLL